jgi:hypothetical protein
MLTLQPYLLLHMPLYYASYYDANFFPRKNTFKYKRNLKPAKYLLNCFDLTCEK